ncbi:Tricorn protease C1 domain-containing protein [Salegentibacter agarivorans]|uniref:Tricorn protease C1 domain-containing protein n=1 Tax=Salegentibacter agarivorans TaxID=345907 RepID=A0A1I2LCN5_9FLAO|nr:S41 family peptidase [Salegentibacter agarivorans]SFF76288.1 Tricorn protease C1 domain-containing protein [Salegentibacter agarivorans]
MLFKRLYVLIFIFSGINFYSQIPESLKNTVWTQEGYDRILKIEDSTYSYFNIDKYDCATLVDGKFAGRFRIVNSTDDQLILNPGGIVDYRFKRTEKLPEICTKRSTKKEKSFEDNFKAFWETFDNNYAFFEERDLDWQKVYNNYLPKVQKVQTNHEFALLLKEITRKFNDGHINLEIPDSILENKPQSKSVENSFTQEDIVSDIDSNYLKEINSYNNGVIKWGTVQDSNIGYIRISDMNDFANYVPKEYQKTIKFDSIYNLRKYAAEPLGQFQEEINGVNRIMKKVLSDLKDNDPVIVDLRFNGGGYETVALELLNYFVAQDKEIIKIKARTKEGFTPAQIISLQPETQNPKKIYLLISPVTASAAEIFALGALSYSNIEILGTKSAGIFSEILWKKLPNGWEYSLSNEVYMDREGRAYEKEGVPVDYELNYPTKRFMFYKSFYSNNEFSDLAIEKVLKGNFSD